MDTKEGHVVRYRDEQLPTIMQIAYYIIQKRFKDVHLATSVRVEQDEGRVSSMYQTCACDVCAPVLEFQGLAHGWEYRAGSALIYLLPDLRSFILPTDYELICIVTNLSGRMPFSDV